MLSTINDVFSIVQFFMGLSEKFKNDPKEIALINIADSIRNIDKKIITKQEVYEVAKKHSLPENISIEIFGEHLSHENANKLIQTIESNSGFLGYEKSISPSLIKFKCSHLTFSSFGTPGYLYKLEDGKGTVVYHAGGEDRDRIFSVQWGIGYYYREILKGPTSFLGFPISNEHLTNNQGRAGSKSLFEGGYIEYIPDHNRLHVFRSSLQGTRLVALHDF